MKNLVVFAPILFQGEFFNVAYLYEMVQAFIYLSAIASAVYLINDINDRKRDSLHPIKKNRPIASGALSVSLARSSAVALILFFVPTSFLVLGNFFGVILISYLILQMAYNYHLKNVIILDALTIAAGFILRAFAGAVAIPISISSWLILAIIGGSLLLAFGKRRAERTLLEAQGLSKESTRKILRKYPDSLLDSMISMSASFAIISYSLFTFQTSPEENISGLSAVLPSTLVGAKLLMLTIPIVIYGVARYLYVIYEKKEGESPERVLMQDRPLLATLIIWGLAVLVIMNF